MPKDEAVKAVHETDCTGWLHITIHDPVAGMDLLVDELGFHPVAAEDALTEEERPEFKEFDDHIFFVIPAVTRTPSSRDLGFIEVGFFLRDDMVVTVSTEDVPTLAKWHERLVKRAHTRDPRPAFLMHSILDALLDDYFSVVDELEDQIDTLSEEIYEDRGTTKELIALKREHLALRRRLSPVREVFNALQRRDLEIIPGELQPYIQDLYTNSIRIIESIDLNRDSLSTLFDVRLNVTSFRLNEVIKRMTAISTVLMISTLLAGIYGMNFRFMPELEWKVGYPLALGAMVVCSGLTLLYFRRKRWI